MALKQSMAKRQSMATQQIESKFNVVNNTRDSDGAYFSRFYLCAAAWDSNKGTLWDPDPLQVELPHAVHRRMPFIHFEHIEHNAVGNGLSRETVVWWLQ